MQMNARWSSKECDKGEKRLNVKERLKKRTQRSRREGQRIEDVEVEEEQEVKTFKRRRPSYYCYGRRTCAAREAGTCLTIWIPNHCSCAIPLPFLFPPSPYDLFTSTCVPRVFLGMTRFLCVVQSGALSQKRAPLKKLRMQDWLFLYGCIAYRKR